MPVVKRHDRITALDFISLTTCDIEGQWVPVGIVVEKPPHAKSLEMNTCVQSQDVK